MRKGIAIVLAASIVLLGCATTANAAAPVLKSRDGNVAALQRQVDAQAGRLYPPGMQWVQMATLTSAGTLTHPSFGYSVALSGDTALVGAYGEKGGGAAYVFVRAGTDWKLQARLTAADGAIGDCFGFSVALSGDTALVGAYRDDKDQGAAYVFVRSGTDWNQQAKLTAADGDAYDDFGWSVALEGDTALIGAPAVSIPYPDYPDLYRWVVGSAYVFTRSGAAWSQQAELIAFTIDPEEREGDGMLGMYVALSGDTALLGAPGGYDSVSWPGAAYVFTRAGGQWDYEAKLTAPDGTIGDSFGIAVAVCGDTAIVGARDDAIGLNGKQGSAHVFTRSGRVWSHQAKLTDSDGDEGDYFGYQVALSGDTALIGSVIPAVFVRSNSTWRQERDLPNADGEALGRNVALSGSTALAGAQGGMILPGEAHVFDLVQDDAAPTTKAFGATVKRGKKVRLPFRIDDPVPSCGRATVVLRILRGTQVRKVLRVPGTCACNVKRSYVWKCTLPPGRYTLKVFATDLVGHRQSKVGSARLTVR